MSKEHIKRDSDHYTSKFIVGSLKPVAAILLLPGHLWFTYALIRLVITDVHSRCVGTVWLPVFWLVVIATLVGYVLLLLGALLDRGDVNKVDIDPA